MIDDLGWRELINIASSCEFIIFEGGKHTKVKTKKGQFITTIPRHHKLNSHLVKGILKRFRLFGCDC